MSGPPPIIDAAALVSGLRAADIRTQIQALESEERALRVLLRAAVARERHKTADDGARRRVGERE
jgi:hypothetical protein